MSVVSLIITQLIVGREKTHDGSCVATGRYDDCIAESWLRNAIPGIPRWAKLRVIEFVLPIVSCGVIKNSDSRM